MYKDKTSKHLTNQTTSKQIVKKFDGLTKKCIPTHRPNRTMPQVVHTNPCACLRDISH